MSLITSLLSDQVTIKRRADVSVAPRDSLNNPTYGPPTASWTTVYSSLSCRLAFNRKEIQFAPTGERVLPAGVMYFEKDLDIQHEDRVITADGVEYVVLSVVEGKMFSQVTHKEALLDLP